MAFIESSHEGLITGTSISVYSVLVASPNSNERIVIKSIMIHQNDPNSIFIHIGKLKGSNFYPFIKNWFEEDDTLMNDDGEIFVLDGTNESIVGFYTSGTITNYPSFNVAWGLVT